MTSFKDTEGRSWDVAITVLGIKKVAARAGFKINELLNDGMDKYAELTGDPVLFVSVLFVLCEAQVEKRKLTEDEFFEALAGDCLEGAYEAFQQAFLLFCPSHLRAALTAASAKSKVVKEAVVAAALKRIDAIDPEKEVKRLEKGQSTSSTSAAEQPGSPASIPEG